MLGRISSFEGETKVKGSDGGLGPPAKREQKTQLKQGGVGGSEEHKEAAAKRLAMAMGGIGSRKDPKKSKKEGERVDVVYKYNEGFTNAVRRTVYMRDLF